MTDDDEADVGRSSSEDRPDALFSSALDEHGLRGVLRRGDSYGFVLVSLALLIWVLVPLTAATPVARMPTLVVFVLAVVISLHTSRVGRARVKAAIVVTCGLSAVALVGLAIGNDEVRAVADMGWGVALFGTALVVLRRVLSHERVTSRTLSGAICVYLLVALAFANFAHAIELLSPGSFVAAHGEIDYSALQYWSLVTIATLGYGDIVPVGQAARSLASFEALAGQVFLVVVVARIVSLLGTRRRRPTADGDDDQTGRLP